MPVKLSLAPKSISLFAQLLVTFVALVAATVTGLTLASYRASIQNLQRAAHARAVAIAQTRSQMLTQLLTLRRERAAGFLLSAESLCAEPRARSLAWAEECVGTMLRDFRLTEGAQGASLTYRSRPLSRAGDPVAAPTAQATPWSATIRDGGRTDYVMAARLGDVALALGFDSSSILPFFDDVGGLGALGEVFLIDADGRPMTPLRHGTAPGPLVESAQRCRDDPSDRVVADYRGAPVLRGFSLVSALPGACVVAHLSETEIRAPAASLRNALALSGLAFVAAGVVLSFMAARFIAGPVRRLAGDAHALQAGDFNRRVTADGPTEVRDLGRALAAMAHDLADLVLQEQTARREAEAANRSKDQFLAMLSHELRTPLTAVLGWAHTLQTGTSDSSLVARAAAAIARNAEAQRRLIEDLLDVTGIAAGRVRMAPAATSLATVIRDALDAVAPRAEEKGVRLRYEPEQDAITVHADPQRLQQIVWNLVSNAIKFTPAGGTITVRARIAGGLAELTVSDTGIGIAPEFLPHVFGWFRRADRTVRNTDEGLGLGLALVRQLVELHGGSVRAESQGRDCGSTFVVTLPLAQDEASPAAPPPAAAPDRLASIRVLVVDDDPGSREAVRVLLEQMGAQVETAASAADARRHLRSAPADVLISDIAMAQESGYTLMQTLRAEGLTLPGIALTGYARREDADKAYTAGFDVHLPKPVDPEILVDLLVAVTRRQSGEV